MRERTIRSFEESSEIHLSDYFRIILRYKWGFLLIFLSSVFIAFLIADSTTPVYESKTTLRVLESQPTAIDPQLSALLRGTSSGAYAAQIQSRDYVVAPAIHQLRAEGLLEPMQLHRGQITQWVADTVGVHLVDPTATEQGDLTLQEWEDAFIKTLIDEELKVEETPDGSVITVTVSQRTPERAQHIANRIGKVFQEVVETEEAERMKWWEKPLPQMMLEQARQSLIEAEEAVLEFQQKHPELVLNMESEEGGAQAQIILALQVRENELIGNLASAAVRLRVYQTELEKLSENVVSETVQQNPTYLLLQETLYNFRIERSLRLGKYDATHPMVSEIDDKIKETEAQLANHEQQSRSTTASYNPLHQALTEKVNETEAAIVGMEKRKQETEAKIAAHFEKLGRWSPTQLEYYRLKRDVRVYNTTVLTLERKRQEAEVFAQTRNESIKVMDMARPPANPVQPRTHVFLALGVLSGILLGSVFAFMKNYAAEETLQRFSGRSSPAFPPHRRGTSLPGTQSGSTYALQAGDGLNILVDGYPEYSTVQTPLPIRSDGYVSYPVTGLIKAVDRTVQEVEAEMQVAFSEYLRGARVFVTLMQPKRHIIVFGAVEPRPEGNLYLFEVDQVYLLQALASANINYETADLTNVSIWRQGELHQTVDYLQLMRAGGPDVPLKDHDTVFIPSVFEQRPVRVIGAAAFPGVYPITAPQVPADQVLKLAGGPRLGIADLHNAEIISNEKRTAVDLTAETSDAMMGPGDTLYIPLAETQISVTGTMDGAREYLFSADSMLLEETPENYGSIAGTEGLPPGTVQLHNSQAKTNLKPTTANEEADEERKRDRTPPHNRADKPRNA